MIHAVTDEVVESPKTVEYKPPFDISRPIFPDRMYVVLNKANFSSKLVAKRSFKAGEIVAPISRITPNAKKSWTTVQFGRDFHIELNSELVYMNNSCNPSVWIDPVHSNVIAARDLEADEELTFFYPSTEWDMDKPFTCWCNSTNCLGVISGAKHIARNELHKYKFSKHIMELLDERDGISS
eukprot:jgi/Hompol1/5349/HPOL_004357-RA